MMEFLGTWPRLVHIHRGFNNYALKLRPKMYPSGYQTAASLSGAL
jgi:hypothetical protein